MSEVGQIKTALKDREPWEQKCALMRRARYGLDRPQVQMVPFPRASNVYVPLIDTTIEQKKAYFAAVPYSSSQIVSFTGLSQQSRPHQAQAASYYDFIVKQKTEFEDEYQYAIDNLLEWGNWFIKITYDRKNEVPVYTAIHPLFIICPWTATSFRKVPWFVHVMQFHKGEFVRKYMKYAKGDKEEWKSKLNELYDGIQDTNEDNDQAGMNRDEYDREGISKSAKGGKIVIWEKHYMDKDGNRRIKSLSPDAPDFDFQDDRKYPYHYTTKMVGEDGQEIEQEQTEWMVEHCRREHIDKKLLSSRGYPELLHEAQYSCTSMLRAFHNDMALKLPGIYHAPNGIPGDTQNITLQQGTILPFKIESVNNGQASPQWIQSLEFSQRMWEARVATGQLALDSESGQGNKTAREVDFIAGMTNLNIKQETVMVAKSLRCVLRQGWRRIVQFKPKSLQYYTEENLDQLPEMALNDDYVLTVNGSAESMNREAQIKNAEVIYKSSVNNPFAKTGEAFKYLLETATPGLVTRLYNDPMQRQASAEMKASDDLTIMMVVYRPITLLPTDDFYVNAVTAVQFLQAASQKGLQVNPQQLALIQKYIQDNRAALQQTNKAMYDKLSQELNQLDMQNKQQMQAQQLQALVQAQRMGAQTPPPPIIQQQPQEALPV